MNARFSAFIALALCLVVAFSTANAHKKYSSYTGYGHGGYSGGGCPPCHCGNNIGPVLPNRPGNYGHNTGYGAQSGSYAGAVAGSYGSSGGQVAGGY